MTYRINRTGSKLFVETDSLKLIKSIYKEETKKGYTMEIKTKHGSRWYKTTIEQLNT